MKKEERILTLHPEEKKGVNILKRKYDLIKDFVINTIKQHETITYKELNDLSIVELTPTFDGKVVWYIVSVKLDLEHRTSS